MATATTPGRLVLQATNTRSHSVRTAAQDASTRPAAPLFDAERQFLNALGTGTGAVAGPSNTGSRSAARPVQAAAISRKRGHGEVIESNSPDALTAAAHAAKKRAVGTTTTAGQPLDPNTKRKVKRADPAQKEKLAQESAQWRAKYKKAFPSFTFYFDSIDENTKTMLSSQVRKLGAVRFLFSFPVLSISIRPFSPSRTVLTYTPLSTVCRQLLLEKGHPRRHDSSSSERHQQGERRLAFVAERPSGQPYGRLGGGQDEEDGGKEPEALLAHERSEVATVRLFFLLLPPPLSDLFSFHMQSERSREEPLHRLAGHPLESARLWLEDLAMRQSVFSFSLPLFWFQSDPDLNLVELQLILTRINSHSPNKADTAITRNPSLPTLLRDEQLYGTRERDPFVLRNDMHYFSQNKYYFLVEDSTGEHRPIVVKEYERPYRGDDGDWPILWGGIEGRTGFYHYDGEITYERKVPPPAPIAQPAAADEKASSRVTAPNLRRALSLQNVARGAAAAGAVGGAHHHPHDSYIAASGNSQIITSNTGTSTAGVRSGAAAASRFALGQGPIMDKRLAVLSNRTVSVAGGALLGNGPSSTSTNANAVASGSGSAQGGRIAALKRQGPGKLQRSVSVDAGLSRRGLMGTSSTAPPPRDEPKKPGYCENCRLKYDDFKDVSWRFLLSPFLLFERD
jgi:hypothetical protein